MIPVLTIVITYERIIWTIFLIAICVVVFYPHVNYDKKRYIFEVQKYHDLGNIHIGYMNILFKTKDEAASYYEKYNPQMRKLDRFGNYRSDYNVSTSFQYVVREYDHEKLTLAGFDRNHNESVFLEQKKCAQCLQNRTIGRFCDSCAINL